MNFKINDKVRIRKDCFLYNSGIENPKDTNGIIDIINNPGKDESIHINWENRKEEWYIEDDLEYWYREALKELCKTIVCEPDNDKTYNDYCLVYGLDSLKSPLTDEELKQCRDLWEKYNKK